MEFIRHRWKMILLVALLIAAILGGAMLFWSSTREKTYTGGLFVKEERQKEVEADLENAIQKGRSGGLSDDELREMFLCILEDLK